MQLPRRNVRLAAGLAVITVLAGIAHVLTTYLLAQRASYPQRIIAAQAADFLSRGYDAAHLLPGMPVDVWKGGTWLTVTGEDGGILASSATDGGKTVSLASCEDAAMPLASCFFVPSGSLPQSLTVELGSGTRQAVIVERFASDQGSGYVFAGRSRERTDARMFTTLCLIVATWLSGMGVFVIANRLSRRP